MDRVSVFTLGGTIESVPVTGRDGVAPSEDRERLRELALSAMSGLGNAVELQITRAAAVNSGALTFLDALDLHTRLVQEVREGAQGLVVATGTDTLEELAFILDLLWDQPVPLVVTGAMRSLGDLGSDAAPNLRAALLVATNPAAENHGCLVVLNGEIHQAWQVRKGHSASVAAFQSTVTGPAGTVIEDKVRLASSPILRPVIKGARAVPQIALLKATMGDEGRLLDALPALGFEGLVIECVGGGSVPPGWVPGLEDLVVGMPIIYTTRTGSGATLTSTYAGTGSEIDLRRIGVCPAGFLDGVHARILLFLLISSGCSREEIGRALGYFENPVPGQSRPQLPAAVSGCAPRDVSRI